MDEITLAPHTALEITPTGSYSTIQNRNSESSGIVYISTHGDNNKVWIELAPGSAVKFDAPLFFMQKTKNTMKLPIVEAA